MARFLAPSGSFVRRARFLCERLESRKLLSATITATLPDANAPALEGAFGVNLSNFFNEPSPGANIAFFSSNLGVIPVQLTPGTTPKTVANFLHYVDKGVYNGTVVAQTQPGVFFAAGSNNLINSQITIIAADAPVQGEFGASNVRGTIAMGLQTLNDPNSATDSFFFNVSDDNAPTFDASELTVFGHIIGAAGLGVMDAISNVPVPVPPPIEGLPTLPILNYTTADMLTVGQLVQFTSISEGSEGFSVSSDNPDVAQGVITGNTLTYSPLAEGTAHLTVTAVGADGVPVSQTFAVVVTPALPASPITPTAVGSIPATFIAGQAAKIHQAVTLSSTSDVDTNATVALTLSPVSGAGAVFSIASVQKHIKIKAGKHINLQLAAKQIAADIPGGDYLASIAVTDANSQTAIVATGQTIHITPLSVDLAGVFSKLPTQVKAGRKASATFVVTNNGNSQATGTLALSITKSTDNSVLEAPSKVVHIKPGKTLAIKLSWAAGTSGEHYFVNAQIDPGNVFSDSDLSNNLIVSAAEVSVL